MHNVPLPDFSAEPEKETPVKRLWGAWETVGFGLAILAVFLVVQVIVVLVFVVTKIAPITELTKNGLLVALATLASAPAGLGFLFLIIQLRKGESFRGYLGLQPISGKTVLALLGILVGLVTVSSLIGNFSTQSVNPQFMINIYNSAGVPALLWIAIVIFAPIFEESFFRGFILTGLKETKLGVNGAVLLTAVAFAALHIQYDIFGMINVLVLGIVLGVIRLQTRSLWSSIFFHAGWNFLALLGTALYVNGILN
jgi:uncharacterized protein